jgi:hypothetical protein
VARQSAHSLAVLEPQAQLVFEGIENVGKLPVEAKYPHGRERNTQPDSGIPFFQTHDGAGRNVQTLGHVANGNAPAKASSDKNPMPTPSSPAASGLPQAKRRAEVKVA